MAKVRVSKKFSINWSDIIRGGIVAVVGAVANVIYQAFNDAVINNVPVVINWQSILNLVIFALVGYLIKNFGIEPAKVITTTETNTKAVNAAEKIKKEVG